LIIGMGDALRSRQARAWAIAIAVMAGGVNHAAPRGSHKPAPVSLDQPGLLIGDFHLTKVTDGDTIRVDGLDASLRLLAIDTEETFKTHADRRDAAADLAAYRIARRGTSPRPVKMATPMGEAAKNFAVQFFDGVDTVRLERDHPAEIRDRYNRYLAYVFVRRDGAWVNYNIACVRAGMAPYFPKYGQSRRFHAEFLAAEAAAKRDKRGIWAPGAPGYTDYPEREAWWAARGELVEAFRHDAEGKPNYVDITHADALQRLEALAGKPVVVLGTVADVRPSDTGPTRVTLSRRLSHDFPLIFFDRDVLAASGITRWLGEFVVVTGTPKLYKQQLEIVIDRASQIRLSPVPGLELR
jgi:endonuclease YncB( thermonuclease family)